jgi:30S ribosomal protein S31
MGKGDRRSKRGKIWRGTTGKSRPKKKKVYRAKRKAAPPKPED